VHVTLSHWVFKCGGHLYSVYATCTDRLALVSKTRANPFFLHTVMEEDKFKKLMTEIRQSRSDVEQKLASTVADCQHRKGHPMISQ